ncbi:CAAX prenyl protease 2-like isoform X2 [Salvia divinorum]|uniref:CAAX prenyl protease 2-like isoform X2 n=1 Tax=Salvia divinorum TaxID=28513 RepID=A0ABD1GNM7_SALDI
MERQDAGSGVTKLAVVSACIGMAVFYVAILYSPTLILRLPPPNSYTSFLTRRFICAAVSSIVSLIGVSLILPITGWDASSLLHVYGIRMDHIIEKGD